MKKISEFKVHNQRFKAGSSKFKVQSLRFELKEKRRMDFSLSQFLRFGLIFLIFTNFACVNKSLLKGNKNVAVVQESNVPDFERDLQTMKTANFDFIFAFRRADGGIFDSEDKKYLRANTPPGTNRFISTDEGRAFIAGSLYAFSPENLNAFETFWGRRRFKPEADHKHKSKSNANR